MSHCTGSHTKFYHRYHVVWVTKYRYKVLKGDMRVRIREIIRQTCNEHLCSVFKHGSPTRANIFCLKGRAKRPFN